MTGGDDFELIGTGPVANVYGGLYLALKAYPPVDEQVLHAFEREQAALVPLRGEVPILPVDEVVWLGDGKPALQMELCSVSLAGLVAESGKLLTTDAVAVGHAVATAVAAAHGVGVVHGGLTPHNVLFHPSGAPMVTDFGTVLRRAFPPAQTEYTAPETRYDGTMDERSDLYGIGAVLHLALTGSPMGEGVQWQDCPADLVKLVRRLLAEEPADRPATVDVVVRQLAAMLEPQTESAAPEPEPDDAVSIEPEKRKRLRARTVVGIAAVATALAALPSLVQDRQAAPPSAASTPPSPTATSSAAAPVTLTLADPVDGGTHVDLAWQAPDGFTFAVVVAAENRQPQIVMARNRSMRVLVEGASKYCFLVQATDGARVLETPPRPIRGAICRT